MLTDKHKLLYPLELFCWLARHDAHELWCDVVAQDQRELTLYVIKRKHVLIDAWKEHGKTKYEVFIRLDVKGAMEAADALMSGGRLVIVHGNEVSKT